MKIRKSNIYKFSAVIILIIILTGISYVDAVAQCPMCRMAAESNLQHGGTEGKGLNTGILYMLSMPYLLVLILGFIWYRNRKISSEDPTEKI